MNPGTIVGILCAVLALCGSIVVDCLLFPRDGEDEDRLQEVELLSADEALEEKKAEEEQDPAKPAEDEEMEVVEAEEIPDAAEILRDLETTALDAAPALEAASLSAIEDALRGDDKGGGDFAETLSFSSGRLDGKGRAGVLDSEHEGAFGLTDIDQKPRAIFQTEPNYPAEMRSKRLEGVVTVVLVVDASGKVAEPRVEKSTHPAFDKPALDAVKQWKFEPAIRGGKRVDCRMRVPIRFKRS
jgi:protein TonB